MDTKQYYEFYIKGPLETLGEFGNYDSLSAKFLMLCTGAVESNCGHFIKQVNGPALGHMQIEAETARDILMHWDALNDGALRYTIMGNISEYRLDESDLIYKPAMSTYLARGKYAMDSRPLPNYTGRPDLDIPSFYEYYKCIYNTELGATTFDKWCEALNSNNVFEIEL